MGPCIYPARRALMYCVYKCMCMCEYYSHMDIDIDGQMNKLR